MWTTYLWALGILLVMALTTWLFSLYKRNVSYVDSLWSLMFLAAAACYLTFAERIGERQLLVFILVSLWAVRLSVHLGIRMWGEPEDRRYQDIRRNNQPFEFKSLYIVFGLQSVLAWVISIPLLLSLGSYQEFHSLDYLALALWATGFFFEATSDWQLLSFQRNTSNHGKVLNTGLWRYTRHPNYFGEFCIWWGFYLLAIPSGGWWTLYAPVLMSGLLLKVSGVGLMEKGISERRPAYRRYAEQTNVFFPGLPRERPDVTGPGVEQ